jgi:hypothetical protein
MISIQLPELAKTRERQNSRTKTKHGSAKVSDAHLAIENIEVLVAEILRELVYVILFIKSKERFRKVRIGEVTLAERVAEVARVVVYYLFDDTLAVSILKLRSCLEKIKAGVCERHVSHNLRKI